MSPTARTGTILGRFPRHLDVTAPGKLIGDAVDALSAGLDVQTSQVGAVRTAHRLGQAPDAADLLLLAGLHGLGAAHADLLGLRLGAARALRSAVAGATGDEAIADAIDGLPGVLGVPATAFEPRPAEAPNRAPAAARLVAALDGLTSHASEVSLLRGTVRAVIGEHARGNATVDGVLGAAAAYLQLDVEAVDHSEDRFWHLARCRDRLRLAHAPAPESDLLAVEENPFVAKDIEPVARRHAERFRIVRGGMETVPVTVVLTGVEDRLVGPMVVNLDTGAGVAYPGVVAGGEELRFERDGRVTLEGESVARFGYAFQGAVFADADAAHRRDFVWAADADADAGAGAGDAGDRAGRFAVAEPVAGAFDAGAVFPHAGGLLPAATMAVGESRWAFFVAVGATAGRGPAGGPVPPVPAFAAGHFDRSVLAAAPGEVPDPAATVAFEWEEREPFALTLWIPMRFSALDVDGDLAVRERLRTLLERHRAAGVHVTVRYADDRWTLGRGVLRDAGSTDPRGLVVVGTRLWPAPGEGD